MVLGDYYNLNLGVSFGLPWLCWGGLLGQVSCNFTLAFALSSWEWIHSFKFNPNLGGMEILCPPDSPFLSLRPEITHNVINPGWEHITTVRRALQVTRGGEPRPYIKVTHLESKPSSAKTAAYGCWVLSRKHCTLISNDPHGVLLVFFCLFKSSLGLVDSSRTPTLCVLWTLALLNLDINYFL